MKVKMVETINNRGEILYKCLDSQKRLVLRSKCDYYTVLSMLLMRGYTVYHASEIV